MRFDINQYETVEQRVKRFLDIHPDGRIITDCEIGGVDGMWLFRALVFLNADEQERGLPKATGYASERDGGPQSEWKAELGETSAIGRALANMGLHGSKRPSAEEMQKVKRASRDWVAEAGKLTDKDALRLLYAEAHAAKASQDTLDKIKEFADAIQPDSGERQRTARSLPPSTSEKSSK
jgi:hypothetical protein